MSDTDTLQAHILLRNVREYQFKNTIARRTKRGVGPDIRSSFDSYLIISCDDQQDVA